MHMKRRMQKHSPITGYIRAMFLHPSFLMYVWETHKVKVFKGNNNMKHTPAKSVKKNKLSFMYTKVLYDDSQTNKPKRTEKVYRIY